MMRTILLCLVAACGSVVATSDAPVVDAASTDSGLGAWSTPTKISQLNSATVDQDPTVTDDLLEVIIASDRTGTTGSSDLWSSTREKVADPFGIPMVIPVVNGTFNEQQPWISPDGLRMYFASDRAGTLDIFVTVRATRTSPWSMPSAVTELNTGSIEEVGGLTDDLLAIVFTSDRGGPATARDIYFATRAVATDPFGVPVVVTALATSGIETAPGFAAQGTVVYFARNNDIWFVDRMGATFGSPMKIVELSTALIEGDPEVIDDQRTMLLSRDDATGTGHDIFLTTR